MLLINSLTSDPKQTNTWVLPDGTVISASIVFKPMQFGWFFTRITYGDFVVEGLRICVSPNMLRQFKNLLPFGLGCFAKENREPTLQEDFSSGNAQLYILTNAEKEEYEAILSG